MKLPRPLKRRKRWRPAPTERELRQIEIGLLQRQVWVSFANAMATIALSVALLTLTYGQWRTAESTAAIERAKARPHFRIVQENQHDELGFLPRRFNVEADGGTSDALHASARSVMSIMFTSRDLNLSGQCLASFVNFYGWTNDALSFEMNGAAVRLMNFSRTPDTISENYIRLAPAWVLIDVDYLDIFGEPGQQQLLLAGGRPTPQSLTRGMLTSQAEIELHLATDPQGQVVLHRVDEGPLSEGCANALRVMSRIQWLRLSRPGEIPQDTVIPFAPS
jgi:hypothetical protein